MVETSIIMFFFYCLSGFKPTSVLPSFSKGCDNENATRTHHWLVSKLCIIFMKSHIFLDAARRTSSVSLITVTLYAE